MTAVFAVFNYRKAAYINKSLKQIQRDLKIAKPATMLLVPLFVETFYKLIMNSVRKQKKEKKLAAGGRISNMLLAVGIDKRDTMFQEVRD
jgi:long-chain acyl-CoA synthetase